ncbi:MAG: hypothetical protein M0Q91_04725 [Methanoregula sp.]|jgi:hypothetical protein|nr:hypothetical protein [Methanoregula sp.]
MTTHRSATETGITLYLIPTVIARQIKRQEAAVYRISVKRACKHHYNITVRTKSLNREFKVRNERALPFDDDSVDDTNSNGESGGAQ